MIERLATVAVIAALGDAGRRLRTHTTVLDHDVAPSELLALECLDVQDRLAGLEIRTLVLAGELDASCTPEIVAAIAGRIPAALYEELPGTPHMQTLERPELVAQALDRFPPTSMPDRTKHR